ncbi:MAG TPA: DUF362 domain-containing protein [Candidatus Hydrogenedentes bacterium]|nr:DUF362 domain-containing protein [Candidatus Hydrogenedentota bacterium]HOL76927.1 DUF362 domain-containing protein [Candidatus Hydrogenedentota bacterium]HPO87297.1 DUF362 domain-containing protein [Candidatus Hydrogenedentota bacterium]
MMKKTSRRTFLGITASAATAAFIHPVGFSQENASPVDMCVARWQGETSAYDDAVVASKLTEQAIQALGGMQRFVSKGDTVWIKPNIAWNRTPEQAANTNPDVVATLVRLCLEAGAKIVKVGDNTCADAKQTYPMSGIEAAVRKAGGKMVYVDNNRFRKMSINGEVLKEWEVYPEIIESDLVINVPVVKHHSLSTATLCMKNYMGVIGGSRGQWHQDFAGYLCDMTAFMKPRLCVLDAVRILTANGPTGGNVADVKRMNTIAAGTDIVALDAFGAELLGHKAEDLPSVRRGEARGLGRADYRKLAFREVSVS